MRFFLFGPRIAGIKTGISIGPEDFARSGQPTSASTTASENRSFIYVVKSDSGLVKVGITENPNARLTQLQSASAVPLQFAWIGCPQGDAAAVERATHNMLAQYRRGGEWFQVAPDAAVGAINAAAYKLGRQMLGVTPERAEQIRQIASLPSRKSSTVWSRIGHGVLQLLAGAVLAVAVLVFFAFSIGRILF